MKLRGLVPNFYNHVSLSDIYCIVFSRSVRLFFCIAVADRSWEYINRSQIHECRNREQGRAVSFLEIFVSNFRCSVSDKALVHKVLSRLEFELMSS